MKKLLSIMLTVCMLLTMVVVPVNVFATEEATYEETTLGSYYKFTFTEGDIYNYVPSDTTTENSVGIETYKDNDFYPLWTNAKNGAKSITAGYKAVTDNKTNAVYNTLQITNGASDVVYFTPLTKDGKPFELTPGQLYRVKVNIFSPRVSTWGQVFVAAAGNNEKKQAKYTGLVFSDTKDFATATTTTSAYTGAPFRAGGYGTVSGNEYSVNLADGDYGKSGVTYTSYQDKNGTYDTNKNRFVTSGTLKYVLVTETVDPENVPEGYIVDDTTRNSASPKYYRLAQSGETATHRLITSPKSRYINAYQTVETYMGIPESYADEYTADNGEKGYNVTITSNGVDYNNNNYLTFQFTGGNVNANKNSIYSHFTSENADTENAVPCTFQIESIEIYEAGKGFANFHVGDEVTSVKGEAGEEIDFYAPAAPEGKYFVNWYTDPEFTTPVKASTRKAEGTNNQVTEYISPLFTEGVCANYYARFEDYGTYSRDDFDTLIPGEKLTQYVEGTWTQSYDYDPKEDVTDPRNYVHTKAEGFEFPRYGYSFKNNYDANTKSKNGVPATIEDLRNHLRRVYGEDYDVTHPAGVLSTFSVNTWGMPGPILFKNPDGTMFVPMPGATYTAKVRYRLLLKNADTGVTFGLYYGAYPIKYENASSTKDTTIKGTAGTLVTATEQTEAWSEATLSIKIPTTISNNTVPALYINADGMSKIATDTNDTYNFMVLQFDYIEIEKDKEVTFINGNSTSKEGYVKGATINYPALTADYNYDYVWSLSDKEYIPAPKTAEEDITVYAYQNPVISMENMPTDDYVNNGRQLSSTIVDQDWLDDNNISGAVLTGNKVARIRNYEATILEAKPSDTKWDKYYNYAKYDAETDSWAALTAKEDFVLGTHAEIRNNSVEQGQLPVHLFSNDTYHWQKVTWTSAPKDWYDTYENGKIKTGGFWDEYYFIDENGEYVQSKTIFTSTEEEPGIPFETHEWYHKVVSFDVKVTFKYWADEDNTTPVSVVPYLWIPRNLWWGSKALSDYTITLPAGSSNGWQTVEMYVKAVDVYPANSVKNQNLALSLKFDSTEAAKNTIEVYVDDVTVEDYEVEEGNVVVTFMRYDAEKKIFTREIKQGTPGAPINVPTNNYDPKWYSVSDEMDANNIVSVYPSEATTLYNATYVQNNPVDGQGGTSVVGDGKANGGTEQEWTFENSLYDGKYALHIGDAKKGIVTNDVENYVTGTVLQQGHTYKVTFKYQASVAHGKFGFTFTSCQGDNYWSNDGAKGSITINAGEATDGWVTANAYFTADLSGTVQDETETGLDYNVQRTSWKNNLFMTYTQDAFEAGNDLYFADIEVTDLGNAVVEEAGASILTDDAAEEADQQAMRFYFTYKTANGSTIELDGKTFTVVERGFIYRNGKANKGDTVNVMNLAAVNGTNVKKTAKSDAFNECWEYDEATKTMTFSTYVTGFKLENDDRKLEVKAYVTFTDVNGATFTIYSDSINRMVEGVGAGTDIDFDAGQ